MFLKTSARLLLIACLTLGSLARDNNNDKTDLVLQKIQNKLSVELDKASHRKLQFSGTNESGLTSEDAKNAIVHDLPEYLVQSFKPQVDAFLIQPTLERKEIEKAWKEHASSKTMLWMDEHGEIMGLVSVRHDGKRLQKRTEVGIIIAIIAIVVFAVMVLAPLWGCLIACGEEQFRAARLARQVEEVAPPAAIHMV
jgi:hypothetical protein